MRPKQNKTSHAPRLSITLSSLDWQLSNLVILVAFPESWCPAVTAGAIRCKARPRRHSSLLVSPSFSRRSRFSFLVSLGQLRNNARRSTPSIIPPHSSTSSIRYHSILSIDSTSSTPQRLHFFHSCLYPIAGGCLLSAPTSASRLRRLAISAHPIHQASVMLIDGEKYACDACVRGHRVSNCQHLGRCSKTSQMLYNRR